MVGFIIAFLFGCCQTWLTAHLLKAFNKRLGKRIFAIFSLKIFAYAVGIALAIFKYIWHFDILLCGFIVGVPIAAISLFILKTAFKK